MPTPKVFDIVFKTEVEAIDLETAIEEAKSNIQKNQGTHIYDGIIRDDDLYNGEKDFASRHVNHVVVLPPDNRQKLEGIILDLTSPHANLSEEQKTKLRQQAIKILN